MKPHSLIKRDDHMCDADQFALDVRVEKRGNTFIEKLLSSLIAIVVVLGIFATTPYFMSFLKSPKPNAEIIKPVSQVLATNTHIDAYIWTAKLKLEDLKLNHRLKISTTDQSEIKIEGNISLREVSNWDSFLKWYESKNAFPKLIHAVSASETNGDIPELKSVWFDASPTAYFIDGRFGNIGTVLNDGWEIVSIEAWAVFVERDGVTITLSY